MGTWYNIYNVLLCVTCHGWEVTLCWVLVSNNFMKVVVRFVVWPEWHFFSRLTLHSFISIYVECGFLTIFLPFISRMFSMYLSHWMLCFMNKSHFGIICDISMSGAMQEVGCFLWGYLVRVGPTLNSFFTGVVLYGKHHGWEDIVLVEMKSSGMLHTQVVKYCIAWCQSIRR